MKIKSILLFVSISILSIQFAICKTEKTIVEKIKDKTLIVVIPDEKAPLYAGLIDAVEGSWQLTPYKFMSDDDAKKYFSNDKYFFLILSYFSMEGNPTSVFNMQFNLKQSKWNALEREEKLTPLLTHYMSYIGGATIQTNSDVSIKELAIQQMKLNMYHLIWLINKNQNSTHEYTHIENVDYYGIKKKNFDTKTTLLIDKNQIGMNDAKIDRKEIIKTNLNRPDLKILLVDYSELEMALQKKDTDIMICANGSVYS